MKILIADDDATSRLVLEATLRKLGHEVVVTENGRQAWEAFRKEYFREGDTIGWMKPEVWAGMEHTLRPQSVLTQPVEVAEVYTLQFLQEIYQK